MFESQVSNKNGIWLPIYLSIGSQTIMSSLKMKLYCVIFVTLTTLQWMCAPVTIPKSADLTAAGVQTYCVIASNYVCKPTMVLQILQSSCSPHPFMVLIAIVQNGHLRICLNEFLGAAIGLNAPSRPFFIEIVGIYHFSANICMKRVVMLWFAYPNLFLWERFSTTHSKRLCLR